MFKAYLLIRRDICEYIQAHKGDADTRVQGAIARIQGKTDAVERRRKRGQVERPANLARARKLGYRAKQGVLVVRVKVTKGRSKRRQPSGGRKPSKSGRYYSRAKSMQSIAEERASKKFVNCEVFNSYYVGDTGTHSYYEIIMLDRTAPTIRADPLYAQIISKRNRAVRGLTASGKRHRGLM